MSNRLVQNASKNNKAQTINYCLMNEPCHRKRNMARQLNISLAIVTHDNGLTKKKHFLEQYYPPCKPTKTFI